MNRIFLLGLVLVTWLTGCKTNEVSLSYTNARDEVPVLGNLVFRFNSNVATDSMLNKWDSSNYISFSPEIKGRFRWEAKDQLVFSPAGALKPATTYTATFAEKVTLQHTRYNSILVKEPLRFHTPDLTLEKHLLVWEKEEGSGNTVPVIEMHFNYPVSPQLLEKNIKVTVDEKQVPLTFETLSTSTVIKAKVNSVKVEDRDYPVAITLMKGMVPEGGKNGLADNKTLEGEWLSPFVLTITEVTTEHDGNTGLVYIRTNQTISGDNVSQFIEIEPGVKYSVEKTDNGLLVSSSVFNVESGYVVKLKPGLKGQLGGVLKEGYETAVTFGELEPSLSFANNKAVYLSAAGQKNIELRITNVEKIKLVVSKVYENNLLASDNYGFYPRENNNDDYYDYRNDEGYTAGDVLYEQEIETKNLPKFGASRLLHFNPADKIPGFKGVYHIVVRSTKDYWVSGARFVSLSDIGLIAKSGAGKMLVFANSLQSANPISGVGVQVYGTNNQLIGNGSTNSEGFADIELSQQGMLSGFKPAMVVARLGDDFNYLPFNNTKVNVSKFQVGGKTINSTGMDAFIAPERDLYRPGETIHFAVVARDINRKSPGAIPVKMKMLTPNGKELTQLRKTLDSEGVTDASIPIPQTAITGTYIMELYNGNDVLIRTYNFKVEEFVPDRIIVTAKTDKAWLRPGMETQLQIDAVNYFGPPAAGRNYEAELEIREKPFRPQQYPNFDFSISNRQQFFDNILRQGKTNELGKAVESFTIPENYKGMGLLQARFFTTVFDENGRPVARNTMADVLTQDVLVGIGGSGYNYVPLNQPIRIPLLALNPQEKLVSAKAQVSVIKYEYRTVLQKSGGYFRYDSQREEKLLQKQDVTIQGESFGFSFIPKLAGDYEVRVALPGSPTYVSTRFYSYGSWGSTIGDFEVNSDGQVDISLDKMEYKKGERVRALFKTPFDGKMLVTIESSEVLSHQWVEVKNRAGSLEIALTDEHLPNAYLTATLFKPHTAGRALPLTAAHGLTNITVSDEGKRLPVSIGAAKTSRSEKKQRVTVKAPSGSMVCLAAVDNGVLAVTNFKTPDPYQWYFSKKALGVEAWDLYPLLFPEIRRSLSSTGGDGDLSMNLRQNPFANKRFKLMSYWSGWKKAGSGEASFEVDIPSFNGQVRIMAFAVNGDRFGAAEATMAVADPLVLSTSMPRFLTPGDTVYAGVTISNTTNKPASVTAKLSTEGPLQAGSGQSLSANIAPNSEERLSFPVMASAVPGMGRLQLSVTGLGETFKEVMDISVRPASTLQQRTGSGLVSGGGKVNVNMPVADFMNQSLDYQLIVGRSPVLQLGTSLRYLVNYPHGCTEQTISAAFPQLYFAELSSLMQEGKGYVQAAQSNVQTAIQRIKMRQLYNGGLTMWDAEGVESWWATAYAAHFLLEARKAGYAPDASLVETLLQYLAARLRKKEQVDYYYNGNLQKRIAPKEVAYSLYVLALAGRPSIPAMNYYKANSGNLSLDSRYVLAATYALAGDKKSFNQMLPAAFSGEISVATGNGSLYSPIRDEALALNVLLEVQPNHPQVPVMAKHIVDKLNAQTFMTTQEAAFSLLALGKLAAISGKSTVTAEILANGKKVGSLSGEVLKLGKAKMLSPNVTLEAKGNGNLYYWWQASGISSTGQFVPADNFLKVRRSWYDRNGKQITGTQCRQNDLIVVKITLEKSFNGNLDNIVITDLLPAGWEIENARIKDMAGINWITDETQPLSKDIRDDRIHIFTNMANSKQVFYYSVRAVTPGNYQYGPVSADAMYKPEYHSYYGAGRIKVIR